MHRGTTSRGLQQAQRTDSIQPVLADGTSGPPGRSQGRTLSPAIILDRGCDVLNSLLASLRRSFRQCAHPGWYVCRHSWHVCSNLDGRGRRPSCPRRRLCSSPRSRTPVPWKPHHCRSTPRWRSQLLGHQPAGRVDVSLIFRSVCSGQYAGITSTRKGKPMTMYFICASEHPPPQVTATPAKCICI